MTREQFITHVESTQNSFRRFLTALCCGDSRLADDIAQESYITAYLSSDGLDNPDRFSSWLFRIGYTTFLNHKRSERTTLGYDAAENFPAGESADSSFRYQALYAALDRLPAKERTAILLFYLEGYQVKEIAGIVDASQDAVKQYLSRGRKHLKELLEA